MKKFILFVIALLVVGCASQPCAEQAKPFVIEVDKLSARFDDANKIAGSTPRMGLAPVISDLQEIRREVTALTPPECAKAVQDSMVVYMDSVITSYLGFMSQESEDKLKGHLEQTKTDLEKFATELRKLKAGQEPYN